MGADAEDKTPANEGFSEKIYRDITGQDISEHGQFEMPPVGGDPWDAGNAGGQAVPEPPYMYSEEFYKDIDLKGMNYEDMATQNWKVKEEIHNNSLEQDHKRLSEAAGDDVDQKDGPGFDINASNFQNVWTDSARPMQFGHTDPNAVAYYKSAEGTDTREELEANFKDNLHTRDQQLFEKHQTHQREALGDAAEDVGEGLGGFVEQIPFVGDAAEDVVDHVVDEAEMQANIEMHPPENDPGMFE